MHGGELTRRGPCAILILTSAVIASAAMQPAIVPDRAPLFDNRVYPAGVTPWGIATADFDADGHLDLAVADASRNSVSLLHGFGDGTFGPPAQLPAGLEPTAIVATDLNHDGRPDLVVANSAQSKDGAVDGDVTVFLGAGDGTFGEATHIPMGNQPRDVVVADLDADGHPDIASANFGSKDVSIRLGTGDGTFGPEARFDWGAWPYRLTSADFNGDGMADLAVAGYDGFASVLLATGGGGVALAATVPGNTGVVAVEAGDLNGNGRLDLVVYDANGGLFVFPGLGNGQLDAPATYATDYGFASIAVHDLDGDGALDVAVPLGGRGEIGVFRGLGDGTLTSESRYSTGNSPFEVVVADFDEDGSPDMGIANAGGDVSIKLGHGDGTFDTVPRYRAGVSPWSIVVDDFDGDGRLDAATANMNSHDVSVLPGAGDGSFGAESRIPLPGTDSFPADIRSTDLNRDGAPDLAVLLLGLSEVAVLFGHGDGTFEGAVQYPMGSDPWSLAVTDVTGDGIEDMLTANSSANDVSLRAGLGGGTFGDEIRMSAGPQPRAVVAGDFDGDGIRDIAAVLLGDYGDDVGGVAVLPGLGRGGFGPALRFAAGILPTYATVADLNRDGLDDLAVSSDGLDNGDARVEVLLGSAVNILGPAQRYDTGYVPQALVAADLNGDHILDLAAAASVMIVLIGRGDGTFDPELRYEAGYYPTGIAAADLDSDGLVDLVAANTYQAGNAVAVLLNRGAVTVSNHPPVAAAGSDRVVHCNSRNHTVRLDGSGSSDPDSPPGTNDDILSFEWFKNYGLPTERLIGHGEVITLLSVCGLRLSGGLLGQGVHTFTLKVTDTQGEFTTDSVQVTVDRTRPAELGGGSPRRRIERRDPTWEHRR